MWFSPLTKPRLTQQAAQTLAGSITENTVVISVAAGVTIETISKSANPTSPVVRVMPNIGAVVGQSVSAGSRGNLPRLRRSVAGCEVTKRGVCMDGGLCGVPITTAAAAYLAGVLLLAILTGQMPGLILVCRPC